MPAVDEQRERGGQVRRKRSSRLITLRRALLAGALVLAAGIAGVIGFARHLAHKALLDLPHRLGIDVKSETDGYTISRAVKGRTLFTVHAARAIQRENGKTTLHDVQVTVYGAPGSGRTDVIRGAEFEYDQPNGVVRAMGETEIDLSLPKHTATAHSVPTPASARPDRIVVRTAGLVFLEKLGVAATDQPISFEYGSTTGHARGADYDSDAGTLILRQDVHVVSLENGHTERVDADSATMNRDSRTADLQRARLQDAAESFAADAVHVVLRPEGAEGGGSVQSIAGHGNVHVTTESGQRASAREVLATFSSKNKPELATLRGDVQLAMEATTADAATGTVRFDAAGHAKHVALQGAAHLVSTGTAASESRILSADKLDSDLAFAAASGEANASHLQPTDIVATGGAKYVARGLDKAGRPTLSSLAAPVLRALGHAAGKGWQLSHVDAEGGARLDQQDGTGLERTSTSDRLTAEFSAATSAARNSSSDLSGAGELRQAVQDGHVLIVEHSPAQVAAAGKPARPAGTSRAAASHAEFVAATGVLTLTGSPTVDDAASQIAADRIVTHRDTGDTDADGSVRGSFQQAHASGTPAPTASAASADVTHFSADQAHWLRRSDEITLLGTTRPARLWTSGGQLEAPSLTALRGSGTLSAHSAGASLVKAVLPAQSSAPPDTKATAKSAPANGTVRILARDLIYRQPPGAVQGQADFSGGVRMVSASGTVVSDTLTALTKAGGGSAAGSPLGGSLQTATAAGNVHVVQPGRVAAGERLVYTASDERFVLTGTPAVPPVVRDSAQGTVTGTRLTFRQGDSSVEVAGAPGAPVRTEADVPAAHGNAQPRSPAAGKTSPKR